MSLLQKHSSWLDLNGFCIIFSYTVAYVHQLTESKVVKEVTAVEKSLIFTFFPVTYHDAPQKCCPPEARELLSVQEHEKQLSDSRLLLSQEMLFFFFHFSL